MLNRATKYGVENKVENVLKKALTTVEETILEVYAIFSHRPGESCLLVELAHPSITSTGDLRLAAHDIKSHCTQWLNVLAPKIRLFSKSLLSAVDDTNSLAQIRGVLWARTHGDGATGLPASAKHPSAIDEARDQSTWAEAAAFTVDVAVLDNGAGVDGAVASGASLDMWALFFSSIFAELGETLLKNSLVCIRKDVECRLDSILLATTGGQSGLEVPDGGKYIPRTPRAFVANDILTAAEAVVSLLTSELGRLAEDSWSLTERGDEAAAEALNTSFYLLCVQMAAGLANHLRIALQEIHVCIKSVAQQQRGGPSAEGRVNGFEATMGKFIDAALVIGRVSWMLNDRGGMWLQSALKCPACFAKNLRTRIEEQQLEAAFIIADTNGDGIVDAEEAAEALQAVSFVASADVALDPKPFSSFTLAEFFLFSTCLLEEQKPMEYLSSCLDDLLASSLSVWAEWALQHPAALLIEGFSDMTALCCNTGMTDITWRQVHGVWEDKTIELDPDDGDGMEETLYFPAMISPAILCYIEGVAAELSRILSTADLTEATPVGMHQASSIHAADPGGVYGEWAKHGGMRSSGTGDGAVRYARSSAAARASRDLKTMLVGLCDGQQAPAVGACEAAQLQLLLDVLFLQRWLLDVDDGTPSMGAIASTLCDLVDPINLQIYMPHLQTTVAVCWGACRSSLSLLFEEKCVARSSVVSGVSMMPDGAIGSSSGFVALVPKARRFEILPLPLDVVRLLPANGTPRLKNSQGHKPGEAAEEGTDSHAHVRGMQAGRQALAGLMDQVGSVGSVLSAQNVNVQSVLGAASLFLAGRNRRDGDDDPGY